MVGYERGKECFKDPVVPTDDGLALEDYTGECLTYEGEINKLAVNVSFGRCVSCFSVFRRETVAGVTGDCFGHACSDTGSVRSGKNDAKKKTHTH